MALQVIHSVEVNLASDPNQLFSCGHGDSVKSKAERQSK